MTAVTGTAPTTRAVAPTFVDALRGELTLSRRRVAVWVSLGVWAFCIVVFAYLVSYLTTAGAEWYTPEQQSAMIDALLPSGAAHYALTSLPMYGAPQFAILGAILGASDYGRGTIQTLLGRFPRRDGFIAARLANLVLVALAVALVTVLSGLIASVGVAVAEGAPLVPPPLGELALATAAIWLVAAACLALGFALGVLTRNVIAAVALAVGWILGVETLLIGLLAPLVAPLAEVQPYLPAGATSALAAAFAPGAAAQPWPSVVILVVWTAAAGAAAWLTMRTRDLG